MTGTAKEKQLRHAARGSVPGLGVALPPTHICRVSFAKGELVHVLPEWRFPYGTIQAVLSHRKGLVPSVRALIDFLAQAIPCKLSVEA
ncbi:LysR substrate-binding domain-containing protein [Billgrantia lactosivorans]|uniref:LysR substrate-binding domain-containing protein n=1 Tax=Billgrantia lactosivorans TaxID=2185141 RepID=UPI000DAC0E78|nr:LysR substrate-binding domain-containing protein [Halomonas lactosivorans]